MALTPRGFLVKSPSCDNPPKYSLLASVTPTTVADPHWQSSGIEWEDFLCGENLEAFIDLCPTGIAPSGVAETDFVKDAVRETIFCAADPFVVEGSYNCPPVGRPSGEAFEIARKRLLVWESHQVEEALWTGIVNSGDGPTTINPSFAFGNDECSILPTDINPAGALDPIAAISALEEALGDIVACGGIIHVPYRLVAYLARFGLITEEGGLYYTPSGFAVIAGHGYPGTGPGNIPAAANETWVFATGPVLIVRSNIFNTPETLPQAVDRSLNNVVVRSERFYSVGFSCVLLAVRVCINSTC